jgi:hypothetical protein
MSTFEEDEKEVEEFLEDILKGCKENKLCLIDEVLAFLADDVMKQEYRLMELQSQITQRIKWDKIRDPDCKVEENYGLWVLEGEAATEIESVGGEYNVSDYTSIVGLGFPPSQEKNTPFLKTTVTVKAPTLKAAFARGTEALQQVGGHEEFVSDLPKCENK